MFSQFVFVLQVQVKFSPVGQREISVLSELTLGHLRYNRCAAPAKLPT